MTKINKNHPQLLNLLIAATVLALLASPVESRVFPHNILKGCSFKSLNTNSKFSWRWIKRRTGTFRALTVETSSVAEKPEDQELDPLKNVDKKVGPWNLNRMSDFQSKLNLEHSYFSLRDATNIGGVTYKVVTLQEQEIGTILDGCLIKLYSRFDFVSCFDYTKELNKQLTKFQWRWLPMNDGSSQRVVTLEDDSTCESHYADDEEDICF